MPPVVLQKLKADVGEALAHIFRSLDDIGKFNLRRGIEVEHQPSGNVGRKGRTIPRMQFETADLGDCRKTLDAVDLQIRLPVAGNSHQLEQL